MTYERHYYKEEHLIEQFIPWFVAHEGYCEVFEDKDTAGGAPVDSAGFVGERVILIEFKDSLSRSGIAYAGSKGSSIEKKICTVLSNLYGDRDDPITVSLKGWDRKFEPTFVLVANRYSEKALQHLRVLLPTRVKEWRFAYRVIRWNGSEAEILLEQEAAKLDEEALSPIRFPDMPSTAPARRTGMTINDCRRIAHENGVLDRVKSVLNEVRRLGGRRNGGGVSNINFGFPAASNRRLVTTIGLWPNDSSTPTGLLVTYSNESLALCFDIGEGLEDRLPGILGPRKGHLGRARYLRTAGEVKAFFENFRMRV